MPTDRAKIGVPEVILTSTYDAVGNRLGVADNLGTAVSSAYDARNQLISRLWEVEGQQARFDFQYDGRGDRIDTRRYADLLAQDLVGHSTASRDANGRLLNLTHRDPLDAILVQYDSTYDAAGQLTQWPWVLGGVTFWSEAQPTKKRGRPREGGRLW